MADASPLAPMTAAAPCSNSRCLSPSRRQAMNDKTIAKTIIHVIDDDAAMRDSLAFLLDVNGFAPKTYESADAFMGGVNLASLACVISDIRMPGMNGIELVRKLKSGGSSSPVILITGHGDVALAVEAMKAGAVDFIEKPFDDGALVGAIRAAVGARRSRAG